MPSHIIRVSVEFYGNGGYGVIGENFEEMGLTNMEEVHESLSKVMLKEMDKLIEEFEDVVK